MRKASTVWTIAIITFTMVFGTAGRAQDTAPAKPETEAKAPSRAETEGKPVHAYRLDFSVNELEEGKKINTRQYSLNLNADDANEIKIGTRVPVEAAHEQFQYMDVGTSIWCRIGERPDGVALAVTLRFRIREQDTNRGRWCGSSKSTPAHWPYRASQWSSAALTIPTPSGSFSSK